MPSRPASSTPRSIPGRALRSERRRRCPGSRWGGRPNRTRSRPPSSGCSGPRPPTPPAPRCGGPAAYRPAARPPGERDGLSAVLVACVDRRQVAFGRGEEPAGQPDRLEVVVIRGADPGLVELVDARVRAGEEDRRVGGDDELGSRPRGADHPRGEGGLACPRQRRLRLVEQVEALAAETVRGEGEKRFAV